VNRSYFSATLPAIVCSVSLATAWCGDKHEPAISSYRRLELPSPEVDFPAAYALSENGVVAGSVGISSPARWVNGKLDWFDKSVSGQATCVSDDGAWLGGSSSDGTVVFRKHGDEPLEELPLLAHGEDVDAVGYVAGIRGDGTAVGTCRLNDGNTSVEHAVRWSPEGQIERLLPNTAVSSAAAINESGSIIGTYQTTAKAPKHAVLILEGSILDPTEGAEGVSTATALSPGGLIAGTLVQGEDSFWFLNRGGQLTLIPVSSVDGGLAPTAVNDSGLIVGYTSVTGPVACGWMDASTH
jgi:uncharacterized membrane protein